jgi:hypothetical protein
MTRIEKARRRVVLARYVIGVLAAAALGGFAAMARVTHPGTAHSAAGPSTAVAATSTHDDDVDVDDFWGDEDDDDDDSGAFSNTYSNIGPSGGAQPQIQSGAS